MLIRYVWRNCDFHGEKQGADPIDAFWVEATQEEAEDGIFPGLMPTEIAESRKLAVRFHELAQQKDDLARPFCFLVARDLRLIRPLPLIYPTSSMWNAYSPFTAMPEVYIRTLDEIRNLKVPFTNED
ncbi:MAG: hypothetical protein ACYDH1_16145 [Anaerolineaceae bacterium]